MPFKPLIQARNSHILTQREQIHRLQQPPESRHQQRRDPRKHGAPVQPRRLFRGQSPARTHQEPGLIPGLKHDKLGLDGERRREESRDGHLDMRQGQPQGAEQRRVQQERYKEEDIQQRGWTWRFGMFAIRESTGHQG